MSTHMNNMKMRRHRRTQSSSTNQLKEWVTDLAPIKEDKDADSVEKGTKVIFSCLSNEATKRAILASYGENEEKQVIIDKLEDDNEMAKKSNSNRMLFLPAFLRSNYVNSINENVSVSAREPSNQNKQQKYLDLLNLKQIDEEILSEENLGSASARIKLSTSDSGRQLLDKDSTSHLKKKVPNLNLSSAITTFKDEDDTITTLKSSKGVKRPLESQIQRGSVTDRLHDKTQIKKLKDSIKKRKSPSKISNLLSADNKLRLSKLTSLNFLEERKKRVNTNPYHLNTSSSQIQGQVSTSNRSLHGLTNTIKLHEALYHKKSPRKKKQSFSKTQHMGNGNPLTYSTSQIKPSEKLNLYVKSARGHRRTHSDTNSFSKRSLNFSSLIGGNTKRTSRLTGGTKLNLKSSLNEKFNNFKGTKRNNNLARSYNHQSQKSSISRKKVSTKAAPKTAKSTKSNLSYLKFNNKKTISNSNLNRKVVDLRKSTGKIAGIGGLVRHSKTKSSAHTVNTDMIKNIAHSNIQKNHQNLLQHQTNHQNDMRERYSKIESENSNLKKALELLKKESLQQKKLIDMQSEELKKYQKLFKITEFNIYSFKEQNNKASNSNISKKSDKKVDKVLTSQEFKKWMMSTGGKKIDLSKTTAMTTTDTSNDGRNIDEDQLEISELEHHLNLVSDLSPAESLGQFNKIKNINDLKASIQSIKEAIQSITTPQLQDCNFEQYFRAGLLFKG